MDIEHESVMPLRVRCRLLQFAMGHRISTILLKVSPPPPLQWVQCSLHCIPWGNFTALRSPQDKETFAQGKAPASATGLPGPAPAKSLVCVQMDLCQRILPGVRREYGMRHTTHSALPQGPCLPILPLPACLCPIIFLPGPSPTFSSSSVAQGGACLLWCAWKPALALEGWCCFLPSSSNSYAIIKCFTTHLQQPAPAECSLCAFDYAIKYIYSPVQHLLIYKQIPLR